jgi:aryl-alcohol dehydrogenase-like predicted oxidoreductase
MTVETAVLAEGYSISRLIRGGWQLAGGHGAVDEERAIADMFDFVDAGVTTFDCADIYTGVEDMIGRFRRRLAATRGGSALRRLKAHTKFVPDYDKLATLDAAYVGRIIDRSLARLEAERLDLVQFHWWNYEVERHLEVARMLAALQRAGKINLIGGTNFDTPDTAAMIDAGVKIAPMQVQYSVLDQRPENGLTDLCARSGMKLLCYGTVAGGFLSAAWRGAPEPIEPLSNRSLVKYKLIIDDFGGWDLFQALLDVLHAIATRHGVSITAVATRWVLQRPHVVGAIVGARYADHLPDNLTVFAFELDDDDLHAIERVLDQRAGPKGDTYALERDKDGRYGRIMKYNLNEERA